MRRKREYDLGDGKESIKFVLTGDYSTSGTTKTIHSGVIKEIEFSERILVISISIYSWPA